MGCGGMLAAAEWLFNTDAGDTYACAEGGIYAAEGWRAIE